MPHHDPTTNSPTTAAENDAYADGLRDGRRGSPRRESHASERAGVLYDGGYITGEFARTDGEYDSVVATARRALEEATATA